MDNARDLGREHHRLFPDQLLVAVAREAAVVFPNSRHAQFEYLQGYADARRQRDAYLRGE
jgi:hypothetical protein